MSVQINGKSVQAVYRLYRDKKLIVNRQYQRKLVWTLKEKDKLIDSILKGYPLPLFLLAAKNSPDREDEEYFEIIDGMQRLNAIFSFIEHGFAYKDMYFDLNEFTRARQAAESNEFTRMPNGKILLLEKGSCADILDYQLPISIFPGDKEDHITEVFGRINSGGKQLSDQERRQAGVLSEFAKTIRILASEIRGDVSNETLLLSEMPEISIDTSRNPHGYNLHAEDIFWCYQGILRTNDLRSSEDERFLADICASLLFEKPIQATGDYLNKLYDNETEEFDLLNQKLYEYGSEKLINEVKRIFSEIRSMLEKNNSDRFFFRNLVYPNPTSNAQKNPFFAVFMAFHTLIYKENLTPADKESIIKALTNLSKNINVGMKHIKPEDRLSNINIVVGLIRNYFVKADNPSLSHGSDLIMDFENSIRRSKIETMRYEFKQGVLDLYDKRIKNENLFDAILKTICAIANTDPDNDGYIFIGISDSKNDTNKIIELDEIKPAEIGNFSIVGIDREAKILKLNVDKYVALFTSRIKDSELSPTVKTQVLSSIDTINYKGHSVIRIRIPKQSELTFLGDKCYIREGSKTTEINGSAIASMTKKFIARS